MKKLLGKTVCFLLRRHIWRKARKGEPADTKTCRRCDVSVVVNKRKPKGG